MKTVGYWVHATKGEIEHNIVIEEDGYPYLMIGIQKPDGLVVKSFCEGYSWVFKHYINDHNRDIMIKVDVEEMENLMFKVKI